MGKRDGLCNLQVGHARQDCLGLAFCQVKNPALQALRFLHDVIDGIAQVEPDVCCDLVVSGAARVQFLADFTNSVRQGAFTR